MKIKLKKTLYIGLGGTGVATLLKVKKNFIDSYGEIPPMIGFLAIDSDTKSFNKEETSNLVPYGLAHLDELNLDEE